MRTRSVPPVTCLSFGAQRKALYPGYLFCHACDLLEDATSNGNKRANGKQKKYQCTAGHNDDSPLHPTTLIRAYRPKSKNATQKCNHNSSETAPAECNTGEEESCSSTTRDHVLVPGSTSTAISGSGHQERSVSPSSSTNMLSSSLTRSPLKKRFREGPSLSSSELVSTLLGFDVDNDADEEPGRDYDCHDDNEESMTGQLLFYDDDAGDENNMQQSTNNNQPADVDVADAANAYASELTKRNIYLSKCLVNVKRRLHAKIASLESRVADLVKMEKQQHHVGCMLAHNTALTTTTMMTPTEKGQESIHAMTDNVGFENSTSRKQRVNSENSEVSRLLSEVIVNFLKHSPLTADKKRFRRCRLSRIIMDSILALPWTHTQVRESAAILELSCGTTPQVSATHEEKLSPLLLTLLNKNMRGYGCKTKAAVLVNCLWNETFLQGEAQSCMIEKVRSHVRSHVFTPSKVLKAMDLAGFNMSLAGLEVLRRVEVGDKKYCRGFLPSKSSIIRAARKVEKNAEMLCPFKMIGRAFELPTENGNTNTAISAISDFGEGIEFDVIKTVRTLFEAFGLMTDAKERSVELALTSDGAQLTHTISHVMAGLKFNDVGLCDPLTKLPMFLHNPNSLVQSRNLCFPLRVVIAKDSKATLNGFRPLYGMFSSGEVSDLLGCQAFKMSYPGDMKLQWGALDNGGAAKVKEQFCFICPCRSSTLHVPQDESKCSICRKRQQQQYHPGLDNLQCYHYEFVSCPEVRGKLEEELNVVTAVIQGEDINSQRQTSGGKMYVRLPGQPVISDDMLDINFKPQSMSETTAFARQVTDELAQRFMDVTGPLNARQDRLRQQLLREKRILDLREMLKQGEPREKAMYLVMQAVVCVLHLENRVGLKSIESILRSGLSNAIHGKLEWIVSKAKRTRQEDFISCITEIIQTKILGTHEAPSQWRFPLTEDGSMGTLSMDNNRTRSVINELELIIQVSFPESGTNKTKLLRCFPQYRAALTILRKTTDYTDDEIDKFQEHIDSWFCDWVSVYGREGCTNYTHLLSSSHVMRYMKEWRCLYRYSQQGWEALNALIKAYFFRRTNRGGLSRNAEKKSKLLGIGRWLQRRIMWYSGHGDALFMIGDEDEVIQSLEEENDFFDHGSDDDMISYNSEDNDDNIEVSDIEGYTEWDK